MLTDSCEQIFNLNGVNINCRFKYKWSYFSELKHLVSHIEFISLAYGKPNDISETGYKSEFIMNEQHEAFSNIKDLIKSYLNHNKIKVHNLDFELKEERERFVQECFLFN